MATGEDRAPGGEAPEGYDKYAFEPFAVTVDLAVLTVRAGALQVLLIERGREPYSRPLGPARRLRAAPRVRRDGRTA